MGVVGDWGSGGGERFLLDTPLRGRVEVVYELLEVSARNSLLLDLPRVRSELLSLILVQQLVSMRSSARGSMERRDSLDSTAPIVLLAVLPPV